MRASRLAWAVAYSESGSTCEMSGRTFMLRINSKQRASSGAVQLHDACPAPDAKRRVRARHMRVRAHGRRAVPVAADDLEAVEDGQADRQGQLARGDVADEDETAGWPQCAERAHKGRGADRLQRDVDLDRAVHRSGGRVGECEPGCGGARVPRGAESRRTPEASAGCLWYCAPSAATTTSSVPSERRKSTLLSDDVTDVTWQPCMRA